VLVDDLNHARERTRWIILKRSKKIQRREYPEPWRQKLSSREISPLSNKKRRPCKCNINMRDTSSSPANVDSVIRLCAQRVSKVVIETGSDQSSPTHLPCLSRQRALEWVCFVVDICHGDIFRNRSHIHVRWDPRGGAFLILDHRVVGHADWRAGSKVVE
jgi:hypothetical protein